MKPSPGVGGGEQQGSQESGAVSGSPRAHTPRTPNLDTSTGTDHVADTQRCAHQHPQPNEGPQNVDKRAKQSRKATDTQRRRQIHVPRPKSTKAHKREMHVSAQRPQRRWPTPAIRAFVSLKTSPPRLPHSGREPGVPRLRLRLRLPPRVQEKLRGPRPRPCVQRRPPA